MEWILICNNNYYDIKGALDTFSTVTWPQIDGVEMGDTVYCYVTNPYRAILFRSEVDEINLNHMDDSAKEYVKHALFYENKQVYMRLICREKYPEKKFTDAILKENGVESLQITSRVSSELSKLFDTSGQHREIKGNSGKGWKILGVVILCAAIAVGGVWYQREHKKSELYVSALQKVAATQYEDAISIFEQIRDYKDSEEQIANCEEHVKETLYTQAIDLVASKFYEEAITIFEQIGDYMDCKDQIASCKAQIEEAKKEETYSKAIELMQAGSYEQAISEFGIISGYKDTATLLVECEKLNRLQLDPNFSDNHIKDIPCSITVSGDGMASATDAIKSGFPTEKEYPDENNTAITDLIESYYSVSVTNDPDMIFNNLSNSFVEHFALQSNQIQNFIGVDRVFTITGLDDESCLSYFSFHVNCDGCSVPVPGIGCMYMLLNDDGIGFADLSDVNVQEYITKMTTGGSWFSDKVNDLYLLQTSEYTYLDQNTAVNEVTDGRIDLLSYFTHSFSSLVNDVPDLSKAKDVEGEVKWENNSLSITGISSDYIVRAHVFGTDKYSVYGIYIGMPENKLLEQLQGYTLLGTNSDDWTLTASGTDADAIQVAYKLSQGKVSDLYVAINGYMPITVN